jgi:hypothetical protein
VPVCRGANVISTKDLKRLRNLHALVIGSSSAGERDAAWRKLDALLKRIGKTWNDVPWFLLHDKEQTNPDPDPRDAAAASHQNPFESFDPLTTVTGILEKHAYLEPHQSVAIGGWIIHTYIYNRFMVTPRLYITGPMENLGKTVVLDICEQLVAHPKKTGNPSAAVLYHYLDWNPGSTWLVDESDNLDISGTLLSVINNGYRKGGTIDRLMKGEPKKFDVFAPLALAGIGTLPPPTLSRCHVIRMRRHPRSAPPLLRFDLGNADIMQNLNIVYSHIKHWVGKVERGEIVLNHEPVMPDQLHGRIADNWRPLISIADACSPEWGTRVRDAAIAFARSAYENENILVVLLAHIREIFDGRHVIPNVPAVDRLFGKVLTDALNDRDDAPWSEWRGVKGDRPAHRMSQPELSSLLWDYFQIKSGSVWPLRRHDTGAKSAKGYKRKQFEQTWADYCDGDADPGTPAQPNKIRHLRSL